MDGITLSQHDLDDKTAGELEILGKEYALALDIETTGLSLIRDQIEVVTIGTPKGTVVVAIDSTSRPSALGNLLENNSILKIFHNALFDTGFLRRRWDFRVQPLFCTKVAARLSGVSRNPTLAGLCRELLGVTLDKSEQRSDWSTRPLSTQQVEYAASDVRYLHELMRLLTWRLADYGRSDLFQECMRFLPARVELALLSLDDVFSYSLPRASD